MIRFRSLLTKLMLYVIRLFISVFLCSRSPCATHKCHKENGLHAKHENVFMSGHKSAVIVDFFRLTHQLDWLRHFYPINISNLKDRLLNWCMLIFITFVILLFSFYWKLDWKMNRKRAHVIAWLICVTHRQ